MRQPTLACYSFGFNLNLIRYPWKASLESALALVGETGGVYFCECFSEDDTFEDFMDFHRRLNDPRLRIIRHPWGTRHTIQALIANTLLDGIGTDYDFALKLDADEVLAEWSFDQFREDLKFMHYNGYHLGRPFYTHFCPDDRHTFKFIYSSKAILSRTRKGLRFDTGKGGDACALGGTPEFQTRLRVFHYGKLGMGRERESLKKEHDFQQLYTELGFPDPKVEAQLESGYLDYLKVFDLAWERGEFKEYDGPHPKFVQGWLQEQRERELAFQSQQASSHLPQGPSR